MPLGALVFYLQSKHEHELVRDLYITDMLMYTARGFVKEPDKLPRYHDLAKTKGARPGTTWRAPCSEYSEQDIIEMFRGKGVFA